MGIVIESKPEIQSENKTVRVIDITQLLVFIFTLLTSLATVTGLFLWNRSESRSDIRRTEDLISSIHQETKDFHGRLCTIEAEKKAKEKK